MTRVEVVYLRPFFANRVPAGSLAVTDRTPIFHLR